MAETAVELEARLKERWFALWKGLGGPSEAWMQAEWERLAAHYNEPHRAYHGLAHISYLLGMLSKYVRLASNPVAIELAVWFHDVIYDVSKVKPPGTMSNERQSADYALGVMKAARLSTALRDSVEGLVMVTLHNPATHRPQTSDEMLMADLDWSPLGWAWPDFTESAQQIRHEYSDDMGYSQAEFNAGRLAFLKGTLERGERQFYLHEFKSLYGQQALYNIERAIRELQ